MLEVWNLMGWLKCVFKVCWAIFYKNTLQNLYILKCPHEMTCPRIAEGRNPCLFDVRFKNFHMKWLSGHVNETILTSKYSYVVAQKGNTPNIFMKCNYILIFLTFSPKRSSKWYWMPKFMATCGRKAYEETQSRNLSHVYKTWPFGRNCGCETIPRQVRRRSKAEGLIQIFAFAKKWWSSQIYSQRQAYTGSPTWT